MGKGSMSSLSQTSNNWIINWDKQKVAHGKENVTAAHPKDKLEFNLFFKPCAGMWLGWETRGRRGGYRGQVTSETHFDSKVKKKDLWDLK